MPPNCWRRATSMVPWSAAPASRRLNFWLSPRPPKAARSAPLRVTPAWRVFPSNAGPNGRGTRLFARLAAGVADHSCRRHGRDDRRHPASAQRGWRTGHGPHRRAVFGARPGQRAVAHDGDFRRRLLLPEPGDGVEPDRRVTRLSVHHGQCARHPQRSRRAGKHGTRRPHAGARGAGAGAALRADPLGTTTVADLFTRRTSSGGAISPWLRPTSFSML